MGQDHDEHGGRVTPGAEDAILPSLPDGYAAELVAMEWLGMLVRVAGPAGALRALTSYERLGWLGSDARADLVELLGGPGLDVDVDPTRPVEPTAEDHAESYTYVRMLAQL